MKALDVAKYIINHEHSLSREINSIRLNWLLFLVQECIFCEFQTSLFDEDMRIYGEQIVVDEVCWTYRIFGLTDITEKDYIVITNGKVRKRIDKMLDYASQYPTYQIAEIIKGQNPYKMAMHRREKKINLLDIETEFKKHKGGKVC